MILKEEEIKRLKRINNDLSLKEVIEVYLPLSYLLNFYYSSNLRKQTILTQFLGIKSKRIPYIISIAGSVAVGKSTTARILQILLRRWSENRSVEVIATDGFLYPNQILKEYNLMRKKGFPSSYNTYQLIKLISDLKSGVKYVTTPIYSHLIYDIIPNERRIIAQPDILILEGINSMLQNKVSNSHNLHHFFISNFIDFSIYLDAPEELLKNWYVNRFLKLREIASKNPNSYFYNYTHLSKNEAINVANSLWNEINYINLKENILPTRDRASLILTKSQNHVIGKIRLNNNNLSKICK